MIICLSWNAQHCCLWLCTFAMERRNEGSFEANSCCGWDFSVVVEGSSPWNNHNTHWTLTFGNYSQKECAGDRLGWLFPPGLYPLSTGGKYTERTWLQENLCQSYHYIIYHTISDQRTGMAIAEAWFCAQWPIFVLFLRFVFGLLYSWKIQTWPIIRFLTESVTYWFVSVGIW